MTPPPPGILDRLRRTPDSMAVEDQVQARTWAELWDRATRLAHHMRDGHGVRVGDYVASLQGNNVEFYELVFATMVSGAWLVPVNAHLTVDEVEFILDDSDARVVFTDARHADVAGAAARGRDVAAIGDQFDRALASARDSPFDLDGPTGGRMHYTSGTTGRPKGVKGALPPTIAGYLSLLGDMGRSVLMDGRGPHLMTGPHYHAAVSGYALFDMVNGASVVMMPKFDAAGVLQHITARGIAHAHLVPTMFVRLLRLPDDVRAQFDPLSLTVVLHGAAPISPVTKRAMIEWWGTCLVEYWGTSEGGTFTIIGADEWLRHPGSVGRPLPGVEVVVRGDDGQPLESGEVGTLYCRSGTAVRPFRYHNDERKTEDAYLGPGLFTMGDMGYVDADGYVHLTDRATNMIISGGVNVYPAEVEHALLEHPAVADVAVFGVPDDEWGESVKAAVELADDYTPSGALADDIIAFAHQKLATYKTPRSIDFEPSLPRLETGKILTRQLREKYWVGRTRRI